MLQPRYERALASLYADHGFSKRDIWLEDKPHHTSRDRNAEYEKDFNSLHASRRDRDVMLPKFWKIWNKLA